MRNLFFLILLFLVGLMHSHAQTRITGVVKSSADGSPLIGATIRNVETRAATSSAAHGVFTISANVGETLSFSSVGMTTITLKVDGKPIEVFLEQRGDAIDEVVVTAFGVERDRKSLGYSTPKVDGDDVSETQREAFFQGLQGRVPGLSINSSSGMPGASAQIVLRGFSSISGDNSALIVVDGVPIDNSTLNEKDLAINGANRDLDYSNRGMDINPEDIESYTIMKGPEATAMYGSQGAGGAILIVTKKAKAGAFAVNYNYSTRIETVNRFPERQYKYAQGVNGNYDGASANSLGPIYPDNVKLYTNNVDDFFTTGYNHKHNLSISGGNDRVSYRWSNEYNENAGIVPNSMYKRMSSRLNSTVKLSDKLDFNTSFSYIYSDNDKARRGLTGYLMTLMRFNPLYDIKDWIDEKGNRVLHSGTIYNELDNPFWDVYRNIAFDEVNRVLATTNATYRATKWLTFNGTFGLDYSLTHGESVYHAQSYSGSGSSATPRGGTISTYDRSSRTLSGNFAARARTNLGKNFNLLAVLGSNFNDFNFVTNSQYGEDFFDPDFYNINNTFPDTRNARSIQNHYRTIGFFGQTVWGYQELVYLTLSGRMDGASRLMPNNPFFAYPSASIAFNFTDMQFFKNNVPWLEDGKLRSSASLTGKAPFMTYFTRSSMESKFSTGGGYAYGVNGGNDDLQVEMTEDFEAGVEFSLLKKRLAFDFTYYSRLSKDQIILPRLSYGTGFILKMINGGEVKNQGIEIQSRIKPIIYKDFAWDLIFNFTANKGRVLSLAEELPELYESDTWVLAGIRTAVHPGYSIGAVSGTRFERNDNGDVLINPSTGLPIAGNGRYYPIGDRMPKFTLGTINKFTYKAFDLNFLWDLRVGGDVVNGLDYRMFIYGLSKKSLNREEPRVITGVLKDGLENSATPTENSIAVTPYYSSTYYTTNFEPQQFVEKDIWTLRLRDISLRYQLPKSVMRRLGEKTSMSVFMTVTDLLMFTNYTGLDPESNINTPGVGGIGGYGIDFGNMGKPRGFNFGLSLNL
ncbi:SusC/RagA family TonB-linked outer membrane protein [Sphingobacterium sp. KB22]|uniref:SusC/RagA family TonB-linked outer membrane protein n=1 Tax=Sphingobacterium hungaricum TaxID=2082723 RepID=A0A928YPZ7_9SPHI|nr:SusC/RagA family TonB-linked outer membrane protein [Sphingobacterium hungaricum]